MASALPLARPVGESVQLVSTKPASNANSNPNPNAKPAEQSINSNSNSSSTGFGGSRMQMAHQNAPSDDAQRVRVVRGRAYFERMPFDRDTREQLDLRQDWWRSTLKDTPNPGAYPGATGPVQFSADLHKNPVQQTYRFLGDGRRRSLYAHLRDGKVTPGRYLVSDSLSEVLGKTPRTYGFKEKPRNDSQRFGPSPAEYDSRSSWESMSSSGAPMRSSFVSKTERFGSSSTLAPGPGYYEKSHYYAAHMPSALKSLGRAKGIFFSYSPDE